MPIYSLKFLDLAKSLTKTIGLFSKPVHNIKHDGFEK